MDNLTSRFPDGAHNAKQTMCVVVRGANVPGRQIGSKCVTHAPVELHEHKVMQDMQRDVCAGIAILDAPIQIRLAVSQVSREV
jgi:hypothetical protein